MIEKLPVFADSGSKDDDTTFESWAENGWVDERVRYKALNRAFNSPYAKINEIIDEYRELGPQTLTDGSTDYDHVKKLYTTDNCIASPLISSNQFDVGSTFVNFTNCIINYEKKLLICTDAEREIIVFDVATTTVEDTITLPVDSVPVGGYQWDTREVLCDEEYAYVVMYNSGTPSTGDVRIQSYSLSDWTVNTGWPATGTLLFNANEKSWPIHISDDYMAYVDPTYSSGDGIVYKLAKADGTIGSGGQGGQATTVTGPICSDGGRIFTTNGTEINISNMALPGSGSGWPISLTQPCGVACMGPLVATAARDTALDPIITVSHSNHGAMGELDDTANQDYIMGKICTDGRNFYARCAKLLASGSDNIGAIMKINPHFFSGGDPAPGTETVTDITPYIKVFSLSYGEKPYSHNGADTGDICFDGRDIWTSWPNFSNTTGYLFRLPYAALL